MIAGPFRRLACGAIFLGSFAPMVARATPADQKAAAQVLFDQARELVESGDFAAACPKLAESQRIDPGIGTLLWLADCYENSGQTASAWAAFKGAAGMAALRHDEREHVARDRAATLEPKLSRLDIAVPPESALDGLQVRRDGVLLGSAEWGLALPVDPGNHTVRVTAPGHRPWSTMTEIDPSGGVEQVTVPALELADGADRSSAARAGEHRGRFQRVAGLSLAGGGIAAVLLGTFFSFQAKSTYDESNDGTAPHCLPDNQCDAAGIQFRSDANTIATAATIAMGAGVAGVVGGALLFFAAPSSLPAAVAIAPSPAGGAVNATWTF